ncbi:alpha/beta hydrolase [Spirosoma arcticum]
MKPMYLGLLLIVSGLLPVQAAVRTVVSYRSPATGLRLKATVLLPNSYQTQPTKRYPVFYLLHGHTGNFTSWLDYARFSPPYADDYQTIVVLADGGNSFYVNWDGQTDGKPHRWEDAVAQDLVPFIDSSYRTLPTARHRGIGGLSMGGYGALLLGLKHPDLFSVVLSSSGCVRVPEVIMGEFKRDTVDWNSPQRWSPDGDRRADSPGFSTQTERTPKGLIFSTPARAQAHSLFQLLTTLKPDTAPYIHLDCGIGDDFYADNRLLVEALRKGSFRYSYVEIDGKHEVPYWENALAVSMPLLLTRLTLKSPTSTTPR